MTNGETPNVTVALAAYGVVCRAYERIDDFRAKLLGFLPLVSGGVIAALLSGAGGLV